MKKSLYSLLAAAALAFGLMGAGEVASAQPAPGVRASVLPLTVGATTTGAKTAVRNVNVDKTYQTVASTTSGSGTATLALEGSNSLTSWSTIATTTMALSATTSTWTLNSTDRFTWLRVNITALAGTGATLGTWLGY